MLRWLASALLALAPFAALAQQAAPAPAEAPFAEILAACKAGAADRCTGSWRGLDYSIWHDLTSVSFVTPGSKTRWTASCEVDKIEDTISCTLLNGTEGESPYLMLLWGTEWKGASVAVSSLGADDYPGSRDALRVDKGPVHSIGEDDVFGGAAAAAIIRELRAGTLLRLRFYDWPYNLPHDAEVPLDGMSAVLDAALAVVRANGIR